MTAIEIAQLVPFSAKYAIREFSYSIGKNPGKNLQVFDERVFDFFEKLSRSIIKHPQLGKISEMVALAFWLRKGNLKNIASEHHYLVNSERYKIYPLGRVFHICPANVDTMFLYSLAISLICGNANILRVSDKLQDSYVWLLFDVINELLQNEFEYLQDHIRIISYQRDDEINAALSKNSDARIIWGGDATVNTFRKTETNVRGKDLVFADRYSATMIDASAWSHSDAATQEKMVALLYNDAFSFDQKGCSCPQMIFFKGNSEENQKAASGIYKLLSGIAAGKYESDISSLASLKLMQETRDAIDNRAGWLMNSSSYVTFAGLNVDEVPENCGGGYFYCVNVQSADDLKPFLNKGFQTLTHWGLDEKWLSEIAEISAASGIDRIVPLGKALEFGHIWDGYNLVEELTSRKLIAIK